MSVIQIMAHKKSAEASALPPPTPRKTYTRSFSTEVLPSQKSSNQGEVKSGVDSKKPPPVPRTAVIRSASAAVQMKLESEVGAENKPQAPTSVSRSFSFESNSGVRRKIPVVPALSTGHKRHETAHYRQGTLVSPSDGSIFAVLTVGGNGLVPSPSSVAAKVTHPPLHDPTILKLCQDADLAGLITYHSNMELRSISSQTSNCKDSSGRTGLAIACATGNVAIIRELLKIPSIDVNISDNEGNTPLHLAAQAGHADVVSLLTLNPTLMIDSRNLAGLTPLMKAALQGRIRCTRILLLAGASPVLRDFGRGMCAMEWAQYCNRTKCAEIIDKYMEKMQLNPGLGLPGFNNPNRWTSEPDLKKPHPNPVVTKKESWVRSTLKKAMQVVSGSGSANSKPFNVATQLGNAVICASMPILPSSSRRASMAETRAERNAVTVSFTVPKIQVTYWNNAIGVIPPPPSTAPPLPPGQGVAAGPPRAPARSRLVRSRSETSPIPSPAEISQHLKTRESNGRNSKIRL